MQTKDMQQTGLEWVRSVLSGCLAQVEFVLASLVLERKV